MSKKILFIFILLLCFFSLSSCFGGKSEEDFVKDGLESYDTHESFFMRIPKKWKVVTDTNSIIPKPKTGSIELAVTSSTRYDGVSNSLVILSEDIGAEQISASEYVSSLLLKNKKLIPSIKIIKESSILFGSGEDALYSKVFIFDAKYSKDIPALRYFQTAQTCGEKVYVITLSLPTSVDDFLKYEYMLSQFRCK